ncbi:MAG: hypothetical protein ABFS12_16535 [Bacteroidota bacterium]
MKYLVLLFLIIAIISCEKSNDRATVNLTFQATAPSGTVLKSAQSEDFTFDSAYIVLEKIEIKKIETEEDEGESEDKGEYDFFGPYLIDLMSGVGDQLPLVEVEPGIYSKLDAEMAYFEEIGYSFYLHGSFNNGAGETQEVEFEYSYMQSEDFKAENPDGFEISANQINEVLALIDLESLLIGVDLNLAEVDQDGVIRLNKESNNDLADIIESNLEAASELGLDEDENGEIDD